MKILILNVPKFLIVAATRFEVVPLLQEYNVRAFGTDGVFISDETDLSVIITGVGMVNTAFYMGLHKTALFDHVINVGICGAFNRDLCIGQVVNVVGDTLSEMGAENGDEFIKLDDLNLGGSNTFVNQMQFESALLNGLKKVNGITVNKIHGNEESIQKIKAIYNPDVESMEGAAFYSGCRRLTENYYQLRGVSNYVEKRDKSKWNIPLAINNVNEFVIQLIESIK